MKLKAPGGRSLRLEYLLALLVALVLADGLMTQFLIRSGLGREGNILLGGLVSSGWLILVKVAGAVAASVLLWDVGRRHPRLARGCAIGAVAVYTGIVYWNIIVFAASI